MKQKLTMLTCIVLLLTVIVIGRNSTIANASGDYTSQEVKLTEVKDINVYNDYQINEIPINNSIANNNDGGHVYMITLKEDGFLKVLLTARDVKKTITTTTTDSKPSVRQEDATLKCTVYRDQGLLYSVVPTVTATGNTKGETDGKIALDQGVYYVVISSDKYKKTNESSSTEEKVTGKADLIIYYQNIHSNETKRPSAVGNENDIELEKEHVGLLTASNPKDYYKFTLKNKALVKFNYMYGSKNNAQFVVYSPEREELISQSISGNSVWLNVEKYLEPGTYYCSFEAVTANDGGQTNLLITQTVYPLKLKQVNKKKNTYVKVTTIAKPKEIIVVKGKLTNSEMTSSKWTGGQIITETRKFGINKDGYYTVRVTDEYGNMFMQSKKVGSCDHTAPKRPTIRSCKSGNDYISGIAEKNATITVMNGTSSYTCVANAKGKYKCNISYPLSTGTNIIVTATDISGNISSKVNITVK